MYHRFCAIFIVVCFVAAAAGCASEREKNREEILLPKQTGSNFERHITVDNESSFKKVIERESSRPSKKKKKTERTELERAEPEQPEETPTPPEKFR
jgi:hypothetical protein